MTNSGMIVKKVQAALERERRIDVHHYPIRMEFADGVLTMEGEARNIVAKKLGLELAAATPGVTGIVDRLRVTPAELMEDGDIRDHVCRALMEENSLREYTVRALVKGNWESFREASGEAAGVVEVEVRDGIVTLNGNAGSLSHKRLVGVLAWWVPGSRDVVNGLDVIPPEEDNDDEVVDAVRIVLEKDPFVKADQIRVRCRDYVVTLEGQVLKESEREIAEADAWYVFRVEKVINRLTTSE